MQIFINYLNKFYFNILLINRQNMNTQKFETIDYILIVSVNSLFTDLKITLITNIYLELYLDFFIWMP